MSAEFQDLLGEAANLSIITGAAAPVGKWLFHFTNSSEAMRHGRHNLHIAMNVLEALVKERMPVSDTLILDFRSRHEQCVIAMPLFGCVRLTLCRLTAKVDKLANAMRARVDFWANLNVVKSVKIVRRASFLAQSAEDLRAAVQVCIVVKQLSFILIHVQRASDIARNLRLGNGQLSTSR